MNFRRINKFRRLSASDKMIFLETFVVLLLSKITVMVLPFRTVAARLGKLNASSRNDLNEIEQAAAQRIRYAIFAVSANVPWSSVCMDQALAASYMLNRRQVPNTLFLGVRIDDSRKKLDAHAWVECNRKVVVGGQHSCQFKVIAFFSRAGY